MKNLIKKKLSFKFGLLMVASVSCIISLFSIFFIIKGFHSFEKQLNNRLENITKISRTGLATALWQFNSQYVQDFTNSLFLSEDVAFIKVYYKDNTTIQQSVDKYQGKSFDYFLNSSLFITKRTEIFFEDYHVGTMEIALSKMNIKKVIWITTKNSIILMFFVSIAVYLTTFFTIRKFLFTPLKRMEKLMKKVSMGKLDTKFSTGKEDEIGRLEQNIDNMISAMKNLTASRDELNHEIMERKKIEEALRKSEESFREFVEETDNLIAHVDREGKIIYINPIGEKILGKSPENLKGELVTEFIHKNDIEKVITWTNAKVADSIHKAFIENRLCNIESGVMSNWLWTVHFIYNEGEFSGLNCIGHNITKLKEAELERAKLESQLRQAHKLEAVGTLAGGIAHDFNNILGIILGNAELALLYATGQNEKAANKISEIVTASLRAKDVVSQLLSFSRKNEIKKVPLKLDSITKESVKLLRSSIESSIEMKLDIDTKLKTINAEPTQIHQIIINLCTDSAHAMEKNGGQIIIRVKNINIDSANAYKEDLPPGEYVKLEIQDTGHGIPAEIQERVFDPYFTTKETGKGSGMGLSVTHGIVKSHNGYLKLTSSPEKGTCIAILFPVVNSSTRENKNNKENHEIPQGMEKIMLVDDEKSLIIMMEEFLKNLGYSVKSYVNPIDALDDFKADPSEFDLVITDMTMPQMYGNKLARQIGKIRKDLPIILCTGYSDKVDMENLKKDSINIYLEKPFDNKDLGVAVRKLLNAEETLQGKKST